MNDKAQNMPVLVYNWNPEYKKTDYTNSVQLSMNPHPL